MNKKILLFLLFLGLAIAPFIEAGAIGINPAKFNLIYFEPGLEQQFEINIFSDDPLEPIEIYFEGDLKDYASAEPKSFIGEGTSIVTLRLPETSLKPGPSILYVGGIEKKGEGGTIGGLASIRVPIRVFVPYPGRYLEMDFDILDINVGEKTSYRLDVSNLGTEDLVISPTIELYVDDANGELVLTKTLEPIELFSKNSFNSIEELNTSFLKQGNYFALARVDYGEDSLGENLSFRIGHFAIDIEDYDHLFETGKINPFNLEIKSEWNSEIKGVYASIVVTDEGNIVQKMVTPSINLDPWQRVNLTGFFDATNLTTKRYLANINVYYGGSISNKLVAIYTNDPPKEPFVWLNYYSYLLVGILFLVFVIAYLVYWVWKLKSFLRKGGKTHGSKKRKKKK
ncbi:hypothetical protein HN876_01500 [archaeon]|mgnify:CR=1|jgi:hypothetical protein|nr:hypothetical protein [archaeon]MBT6606259.1 hypothetical protein [archaeon]MBT7251572.1 hypothetical protein [archaeon]